MAPSKQKKTIVKIPRKSEKLTSAEQELIKNVKDLTKEVKKMKELEFVRIFKKPGKFLWFSFWRGVLTGLGAVFGATVILSILIFFLSKVQLVPIVGDFVGDVMGQLEEYKQGQ